MTRYRKIIGITDRYIDLVFLDPPIKDLIKVHRQYRILLSKLDKISYSSFVVSSIAHVRCPFCHKLYVMKVSPTGTTLRCNACSSTLKIHVNSTVDVFVP